ncbi:MAG: flagellar hook-length control protein FliK [Halomonas sp.]|uniref:flagellar hook-length control protein FliK n=1 Tax=Halomonas sp. TaxID=1486246 RepID=UPI0019F0D064|nr:flagellar hook-length control protein FliK [Halomonas sp.]MBE0488993.1 flagellar hook-length control protein FliK [Halomonas sp.]
MSGINPLIDTLLHQVLGKRVDFPTARELNEPVRPISPSDAPRALHSDSRLDARARSSLVVDTYRPGREGAVPPVARTGGDLSAPASTQTHFTSAARSIADVLLRFPAPPSALRPAAPLVATSEPATPALTAERLQLSVRDSGLFYESHLNRWYRGEMPREQLLREPQNLLRPQSVVPAAPAPGVGQAGLPNQVIVSDASSLRFLAFEPASPSLIRELVSPLTPASGAQPSERDLSMPGREGAAPVSLPAVREPVQESLQGVVRQQLEMLVTPVLRWEGDVWTGLFMALVMQVPVSERDSPSDQEQRQEGEEQEAWRSDMTLQVAGFGEVQVSLWLKGARLDLGLSAPEPDVRETLARGLDRLEGRLSALGLEEVRVRLLAEALHG